MCALYNISIVRFMNNYRVFRYGWYWKWNAFSGNGQQRFVIYPHITSNAGFHGLIEIYLLYNVTLFNLLQLDTKITDCDLLWYMTKENVRFTLTIVYSI